MQAPSEGPSRRPSHQRQRVAQIVVGCLIASALFAGLGQKAPKAPTTLPFTAPTNPFVKETAEFTLAPVDLPTETEAPFEVVALSDRVQAAQEAIAVAPEEVIHVVEEGENVYVIAQEYDTTDRTIASLNDMSIHDIIHPGDELKVIPGFKGVIHHVTEGESIPYIAELYGVTEDEIYEANDLESDLIQIGQELKIMNPQYYYRGSVASRGGSVDRDTRFSWPTWGVITSYFGPRWGSTHTGLDIGVDVGTPIGAARPGQIIYTGWDGNYGLSVEIDHGGGVVTKYAHLSEIWVSEGDWVERGETIALSGNTGFSTGPHLHFEVIIWGNKQDPLDYLP